MVYVLNDFQTGNEYSEDFHPDDLSQHIKILLSKIPQDTHIDGDTDSLSELNNTTSSNSSVRNSDSISYRRHPKEASEAPTDPMSTEMILEEIKRFEKELAHIKKLTLYYLLLSNAILFLFTTFINYVFEKGNWALSDSFWFSFTAFTTLGYGDVVPEKRTTMAFFGLFVVLGISLFSYIIVLSVDFFYNYAKKKIDGYLAKFG
ncbi:hypothetical protein AYI68_g1118 [Smittium mucronatum]|uniref:Potassium channel domain-containing protein n=1 Tax=Smittium mucronatum TaxID=133383 RepID=A0A1R0H678_9FUNG|nr:hypothetical protein AYI68_g1118 [Smittium mucronatum]